MLIAITRRPLSAVGVDNLTIMNVASSEVLDEALRKWQEVRPGLYISHREIMEADIPLDRSFRDAVSDDGTRLNVDMPRAREIHKERLRALRSPRLAALDAELMIAVEADDKPKQAELAVRKQALRDVTEDPAIAAATTIEELKAVLPAALLLEKI